MSSSYNLGSLDGQNDIKTFILFFSLIIADFGVILIFSECSIENITLFNPLLVRVILLVISSLEYRQLLNYSLF